MNDITEGQLRHVKHHLEAARASILLAKHFTAGYEPLTRTIDRLLEEHSKAQSHVFYNEVWLLIRDPK